MIVHTINLDIRPNRLESIKAQSIQQGFELRRWPGIENKHYPLEGICKAHKQIIRYAHQENMPSITICEDDCCFFAPRAFDYFISKTPEDFDLWMGVIYCGDIDENNRVLNGFSGGMTLYTIHNRFYEFVLSIPDRSHIDRYLGQFAFMYKYFVCDPMVCYQKGGYSDNLKMTLYYDKFLEGKRLFGVPLN